ncbi:MAG: hypothetical protein JSW71_07960 [Gemmatimonadota bacterium]|nr:MAG: hypothetical protein JSW71_07960 [Gemmatimonadota bacterium]
MNRGDILVFGHLVKAIAILGSFSCVGICASASADTLGVGNRWVHEFPDDDGAAGQLSSLAFDSRGNPYIGYWHITSGAFRVAYKEGGAWCVDEVEVTGW